MPSAHAAALLYIGLSGLILAVLSARIIVLRRRLKVALGSGGHAALERAQRAHGNFAEYAPLFLLALAGLSFAGEPVLTIHILGIAFLTGRVIHAWAMTQEGRPQIRGRTVGMILTLVALIVASVMLIGDALSGRLL